jgi:hypothetical protein
LINLALTSKSEPSHNNRENLQIKPALNDLSSWSVRKGIENSYLDDAVADLKHMGCHVQVAEHGELRSIA